jgi:hypothetical protein
MDRKAGTVETLLVKSREMRSQTLPWWLGEEGVKTTENKILYIVPVLGPTIVACTVSTVIVV